jgi:hypothetical protein
MTLLMLLAGVSLAGCGAAADGQPAAQGSARLAHWTRFVRAVRPLDLAGPRADGSLVLAARGQLELVSPSGVVRPYAPAYKSAGGEEPYITFSRGGCFGAGTVYVIRLAKPRGILRVDARGRMRRFASITAGGLIDGITFDGTGAFSHRLLLTINHGKTTTVEAIDCHGRVSAITNTAPRVEGGIAVAPPTFGRFAGDLIAPDENGGRIFAVARTGKSTLVANSGLPHGGDIGVESEAFVPPDRGARAVLADRFTPGNRHPGDDVLLQLTSSALRAAGVQPGDLLVATEGGARTDAIRCGPSACTVTHVADGPPEAHAEGHIAFAR